MPTEAEIRNRPAAQIGQQITASDTKRSWIIPAGATGEDAFPNVAEEFYPEAFGAVGDGSTDDTSAFALMTAAMPATGGCVRLAAKRYKLATWHLDKPISVFGSGMSYFSLANWPTDTNLDLGASVILSSSATLPAIVVHSGGCVFEDLSVVNTRITTSRPSSGAGFYCEAAFGCHWSRVHIEGFFNLVEIVNGHSWSFTNCGLWSPVNVGVKYRYDSIPDGGDMAIMGTYFAVGIGSGPAVAAVECNSSGGMKFCNNKINGSAGDDKFGCGFLLETSGSTATSDLLIANNSIENVAGFGIDLGSDVGFANIVVNGNQFAINEAGVRVRAGISRALLANNIFRDVAVGFDIVAGDQITIGRNQFDGTAEFPVVVRAAATNVRVDRQDVLVVPGAFKRMFRCYTPADSAAGPFLEKDFVENVSVGTAGNLPIMQALCLPYISNGVVTVTYSGVVQGTGGVAGHFQRAFATDGSGGVALTTMGTDVSVGAAAALLSPHIADAGGGAMNIGVAKTGANVFDGEIRVRIDGFIHEVYLLGR